MKITPQALKVMTEKQKESILRLVDGKNEIEVMQDFSVGKDWLYFVLKYKDSTVEMHGGISPEGDTHT